MTRASSRVGGHEYVQTAARTSIDAGAGIFVNTGGLQRGVEFCRGKAILRGLSNLFLQSKRITRVPSSSYEYWKLPPDSTVADLLEVRANEARPGEDKPQQHAVYPLTPTALHSVIFDEANKVVARQPSAVR